MFSLFWLLLKLSINIILTDEPSLHRSYAFIQYDNVDSAQSAIKGESGRMLAGLRIGA